MAREVKPTKVTGGGGFVFEDKVAAFFMCYLLSQRLPLNPCFGTIKRIDFQARADGWLLDDLLLTLQDNVRCAFSIKSNPQFSKTSAPSDFVRDAWEQYLGEGTTCFNRNKDRLGLITSPLDIETKKKLEDLLGKAREQEPHELSLRVREVGYISKEGRSIFESFSCPQDLTQKHSVNENNIGLLLRCIEHLEFDFEYTSSSKLSEAISILRSALESNNPDEANNLWDSFCTIARGLRSYGGCIDLSLLVGKLRKRYRLKDFPDQSLLWEKIKRMTKEEMYLIPDKIGGTVSIDRYNVISEINDTLAKENVIVVLLGDSGSGKTVIGKNIAESRIDSCKVVWVNAENISFLDALPSWEVFKIVPDKTAILIIDGLDRFYNDSDLKKIALLIKACQQDIEKSPWKIIVSCQPQEWDRVQRQILRLNVSPDWKILDINNPTNEELYPVWQKYPSLKKLSLQPHLRQFVFKPKVLDLIASRISSGGNIDLQSWVGESSLINWYWNEEIDAKHDGLRRGAIIKKVAEKLADNLIIELPTTDFSFEELSFIEVLIRERILKQRNDRISFEHDLVADWVRQRILLEKYTQVYEYIKDKLTSPMWSRALRLLGIHFLESEPDLQQWKIIFNSFKEQENHGNFGQDLLLEAAVFSANPSGNLKKLWIELQKNEGVLLRRFLNRFTYSASFPQPLALLIANQYGSEATAEITARYRDPYWLYWIPTIQFLHSHRADVIKLASKQVTEIADKWLRFSKKDWPARSEAAELAIEIAEAMLAQKMSKTHFHDSSDIVKLAFRAGLAACNEQPERAINFALTACSRKLPSGRVFELINKNNEEVRLLEKKNAGQRPKVSNKHLLTILGSDEIEPSQPWPDGPIDRVDYDFQKLCLETDIDALYPIIESFPDKAQEIILALLIEHPHSRSRDDLTQDRYTGLTYEHGWFPPFYTRGPFYYFLNTHPDKGLELIISLINFATERWADRWSNEIEEPPHIDIEYPWGKKKYLGDAYVYYWYRDVGNVSNIIPSVLMALEKWIYDRHEKEENREEAVRLIERILKEAYSLAFMGLLISIGKKNPELFSDHLVPLLSVPEFYSWDIEHILKSERHQMIGWIGRERSMMKFAQMFHEMPHRKLELRGIALSLFLSDENVRKKLEKFREKWQSRFEKSLFDTISPDAFENLILWFDISNWKPKEDQEHGRNVEFEMPKEIVERRQGFKEIEDRWFLLRWPLQFRQILDGLTQLSPIDAEKIWSAIEFASKMELLEGDPERDKKNDAICGGIAVLFKYYRGWLKESPAMEKWCIENVTKLILNPPPEREFDSEDSIGNWIWDRFSAEVMPIIWADDPENPLYRRCMASLAVNKHYETVNILFRAASEKRDILKEHFTQLTNFLLRWAHARWKYYREQYHDKKSFNVDRWLEKEINTFEKGKVSEDALTWEVIAHDEIKRRKRLHEKEIRIRGDSWKPPKETYFDLWLIKAAYDWMPSLEQAANKKEREAWLSFWRQALTWTLNILKTDDDGEISGTPSDWDMWLFEKIAIQVLCMYDSERPEELWQPIFNLGAEGHYWVDDFLMEWFRKGIGAESISDTFVKQWGEMLEYNFESEKWNTSSGCRGYYLKELWCALLGMNDLISDLWGKDKRFLIRQMKQYYERWAKSGLTDPDSAAMFINFLTYPAAEEILFEGLAWLNNASTKEGDRFFNNRHNNTQKYLANLLEIAWKRHKTRIIEHSEVYEAFKNLLRKLVDLQYPQAIEIQQNLLSNNKY